MGGGDLNSKKSWHPNTIKNQERVWKAEQAVAQEKKRIQELQMERAQERDRTELNDLARRTAGVSDDSRLHWMYDPKCIAASCLSAHDIEYKKLDPFYRSMRVFYNENQKPDKKAHDEDYLLGKAVDKNYDKPEKPDDYIPAVARRVVGSSMQATASDIQVLNHLKVDLQRKLREDPLVLVKERERAARAALLNNPLQRKKLTEMLRKEQEKKQTKSKKVPKKKDKDLDDKLASKLNALSGGAKSIDLAALLADDDDETDSSSDGEPTKKKKKSKKKKSDKSKSRISDSHGPIKKSTHINKTTDEETSENDRKPKKPKKIKSKENHSSTRKEKQRNKDIELEKDSHRIDSKSSDHISYRKRRCSSNESRDNFYGIISLKKNIEKNVTERWKNNRRRDSRSPHQKHSDERDSRARMERHSVKQRYWVHDSDERQMETQRDRSEEKERHKQRDRLEDRLKDKRRDRSEDRQKVKRRDRSEEKQRDRLRDRSEDKQRDKRRDRSEEKHRDKPRGSQEINHRNVQSESSSKRKSDSERTVKKSRLGSEERAAKLAAMMAAGAEREIDRGRRVAAQRAHDAADTSAPRGSGLRSETRALPDSLESRIHSNRHYIQRNSRHMNENFAKR